MNSAIRRNIIPGDGFLARVLLQRAIQIQAEAEQRS